MFLDTSLKGSSWSLRSGWITKISSISSPPRSSTEGKPDGPSICPGLTSPCITAWVKLWERPMPCLRDLTMAWGRRTIAIWPYFDQNCSRSEPLKALLPRAKSETSSETSIERSEMGRRRTQWQRLLLNFTKGICILSMLLSGQSKIDCCFSEARYTS